MRDSRLQKLAANLVGYSIDVQPGDNVLIDMIGAERELAKCLVEEVARRGGRPFVELSDRSVLRTLLLHATKEQLELWAERDLRRMKEMNGYIAVRSGGNINELADVPEDKMRMYEQIYQRPVHLEQRVKHTKWVVLRYPNESMAQLAKMSTEAFEDFYFNVCNLDYSRMDKAMEPLRELMERTDQVRIVGPGTDLRFSIRGIGAKNVPASATFRTAKYLPLRSAIPWRERSPTIHRAFTRA
ncbi:hypothetical protein PACILC2_00520 [Paenibacillus cisolokensis]|uniref:Aminopeptidase n=1 Tax=Paenibacillus cisolokensis TaxID=1658519 RepID=A0ABQ4N008_9BACL|nr:hypothetical protein PACILC2_00520 [Paenibacillus cisolokensis]